jgi:WD40-like Beta Propeller Repeat
LLIYDKFDDLAVLDLAKPDHLQQLLHSGFDERLGQISPDGRWIAYESNESGNQFEIVLRSFPDVSRRREILSINGGRYPRWAPRGGNELYYLSADGAIMAVPITLSPALTLGTPKKLFDWQKPGQGRSGLRYDVAPDGRFLMGKAQAPSPDVPTTSRWWSTGSPNCAHANPERVLPLHAMTEAWSSDGCRSSHQRLLFGASRSFDLPFTFAGTSPSSDAPRRTPLSQVSEMM